ncbi:ChaC-like protein [Metschnikowia bicuspidata var. bicuspidata NRRL YB-4993]|uniref:glutathione-specific gamma-glutamylcyclotransferase n=1 Tax=Metschnikowia bicuspidata var. bicuspidata NRRL YB-4993 TaxID=869754 RepID=A0A1A0HDY4_9ASCO|nr:ChaC-like protein [Metschnikowia bicuspidata var. bicuspidata NRRL YB-4993]OBA22309.1 ChaC-like protein [Metschnikowia bicuspidata var. bicuspidata NRRL YB-4993]
MSQNGMWIIGYGSLIFKPPPLVSFRVSGTIQGYIRRFWQSSSDHRGTPELPGRVVTLVPLDDLKQHEIFNGSVHNYEILPSSGADLALKESAQDVSKLQAHDLKVWGVAYYIEPENVEEVKQYLDIREQDGYTLHTVEFHVHSMPDNNPEANDILSALPRADDGDLYIKSHVYIGTIDNQSFVGPESIAKTAQIIKSSRGPSGDNFLYLKNLTTSVIALHSDLASADSYLEALTHLSLPASQMEPKGFSQL